MAKTSAVESHTPILSRMQRFSSWRRLTRAITAIKMVGRCFKEKTTPSFVEMMEQTRHVLISVVQKDVFPSEIQCLQQYKPLSKGSPLKQLPEEVKNPILPPKKSLLSKLLALH
jgi:hypothetical protein